MAGTGLHLRPRLPSVEGPRLLFLAAWLRESELLEASEPLALRPLLRRCRLPRRSSSAWYLERLRDRVLPPRLPSC